MDPALWEVLRTEEPPQEEIEAIVRLDRAEAGVPGLRIISRFGPIATCRLNRDAILQVHEEENVISLKAKRVFSPEPDEEASDEALPLSALPGDVRRPPGLVYTGAGVVVGIVDWGCDFQHPNFRNSDGSTRLLSLWEQRGAMPSITPNRYGYGTVHTREDINRALQHEEPYKDLRYHPGDADPAGTGMHGTHVMDIAAGNGRGGGPLGVAPAADLIFVHLANQDTGGLANLGDSVRILEACDFIARLAGSRPWVINLSVGRHGGPHDGSSLCELAFDYLLSAGPNRFICQSTGNYFDRGIHASGRLRTGEERTLSMKVDEADYTPNELEIWYSGKDEFAIRLESPSGMLSSWAELGEDLDLIENGVLIGRLYNRAFDPNNADHHVDAFLYPAAPPGIWRLTIRAVRVVDGSFHAWLERDDACPECQTCFVENDVDRHYTTGTLANGQIPLVVGAYNLHSPAREITRFSSAGPTRDNRIKPDLVAPGFQVLAARSAPRGSKSNPGLLVRKSGSSMAAPQMTGAVALCLQAARRPLKSHEIRNLILDHLEHVTGNRQTLLRYGGGYLNILRSVQAAESLHAVASPLVQASEDAEPAVNFMEEEMEQSVYDQYLDLLDQVITERAPRAASEKNLLAHILRIHGLTFDPREVDPDRLYRELVSGRRGGQSKRIAGHFMVLARPGEILQGPPQKGDILLRVVLGHPGLGHLAVIADPNLWPDEELAQAPFESERKEPGYYAVVREAGARPHTQDYPFARRVLNKLKQMLPFQILIRPKPLSVEPDPLENLSFSGDWAESSAPLLSDKMTIESMPGDGFAEVSTFIDTNWEGIEVIPQAEVSREEEFDEQEGHFLDAEKMEIGELEEDNLTDDVGLHEDRPAVADNSFQKSLEKMLKIPGRFDDPKRDPAIELDGTQFDEFLNGKDRREFVARWLEEHPALKEASREPSANLKTVDIAKAWFVIHDVGNHTTIKDNKRFRADRNRCKSGSVHGFLNRDGYYAASCDFADTRSGTVYEFMSKKGRKHVMGHTINIETVPDIDVDVPDKADGSRGDPLHPELYASIGYKVSRASKKKVIYYKWTKTAFDVLSDLYILASARAGHLLTITVHKEMDRNLGRSVLWREYSAQELLAWDEKYKLEERVTQIKEAKDRGDKKEATRLRKTDKHYLTALYFPSDYHGDPAGFNIQALYDMITKKLNALGGKQMPSGTRYGIHPRRICKETGENLANRSTHLNEFPHQSDPVLKVDKGLKEPGWWKKTNAGGKAADEWKDESSDESLFTGEERESSFPTSIDTGPTSESIDGEQAAGTAADVDWCRIRRRISCTAFVQEARWTRPNGNKRVESENDMISLLRAYWSAVPGVNAVTMAQQSANDSEPWSAAFICYVMRSAGIRAANGFSFSPRHMEYIVGALRNRERSDRNRPFWLYDHIEMSQGEALPVIGDLLCFNRRDDVTHRMTQHSYASLRRSWWDSNQNVAATGYSHCSIVVDFITRDGQRYLQTIGGNEEHSVRRSEIQINQQGAIMNPGAIHVFGIIKLLGCRNFS